MENELEKSRKHIRTMEINIPLETEKPSLTSPSAPGTTGLARQGSITKNNSNCLCSPTNHAGSFRCRLHRNPTPTTSALTGLLRTKSIDSSAALKDSHSNKANNTSTNETSTSETP